MKTFAQAFFFKAAQVPRHLDIYKRRSRICSFALTLLLVIAPLSNCLNADTRPASEKVHVKILKVKPETWELTSSSVGRLSPNRELKVLAEIEGMITEYYFDTGDKVIKGQILVKIDPRGYQLELEQAQAELQQTKIQYQSALKQYKRSMELVKKKIISREEYDNIEATLKSKQAALTSAKITVQTAEYNIGKTSIKAPFSGMIEGRTAEVGQVVEFGSELYSLIDLSLVRAKVNILEEDYVQLDKKDPVNIDIDAYPQKTFRGVIDKIGISADQKNSFPIEVVISNKTLLLKAGLSARISIVLKKFKNVYFIPSDALAYNIKGPGVYVVNRDNKVAWRPVKYGKANLDRIPIFAGLKVKDRVIIHGQDNVKIGTKVIISN